VARHGRFPAGEDGGHRLLVCSRRETSSINTAMQPFQSTHLQSVFDAVGRDAGRNELSPSHQTLLLPGQ
jgi:hypothetical protein